MLNRLFAPITILLTCCVAAPLVGQQHGDPRPVVTQGRGEAWAVAAGLRTWFGPGRVRFHPAGGAADGGLRLRLESILRGGVTVHGAAARAPLPEVDGAAVTYVRGADIVERYEVRQDGIEQTFTFAKRPAGRGDLVVRLRTDASPGHRLEVTEGSDLETLTLWTSTTEGVHVGAVTGIDANGRRQPGHINYRQGRVELVLPADFVESAAYPMVLDPLFGRRYSAGASFADREPDVAYDVTNDRYLTTFEQLPTSQPNIDIWCMLHAGDNTRRKLNQLATGPGLQLGARVANVNARDRFVVVWQDNASGTFAVRCRTVDAASGALSPIVTIANPTGGASHPDVAGDSRATGDEAIVVWDDAAVGIRAARIRLPASATAAPQVLGAKTIAAGADPLCNTPTISKACGRNGRLAMTWQQSSARITIQVADIAGITLVGRACNFDSPQSRVALPEVDGDGSTFMAVFERYAAGSSGRRDLYGWAFSAPTTPTSCPINHQVGPLLNANTIDHSRPTVGLVGRCFVVPHRRRAGTGPDAAYLLDVRPRSLALCGPAVPMGDPQTRQYDRPTLAAQSSGGGIGDEAIVVVGDSVIGRPQSLVYAQRYVPTRHQLTVQTTNPNAGVAVTVAPNDVNGAGNGPSPRSLSYRDREVVTLGVPATSGSNPFYRWVLDGTPQPVGNRVLQVVMDRVRRATAEYRTRVPGSFTPYGTGCPGTGRRVPVHRGSGTPETTQTLSWDLSSVPASTPVALSFGLRRQAVDLGPFGMPGCTWLVVNQILFQAVSDSSGNARIRFPLADNPTWIGTRIYTQFAVLDPGAPTNLRVTWSNGLDTLIGGLR